MVDPRSAPRTDEHGRYGERTTWLAQFPQEEGSGMRHRQVNETPNQPRRDHTEGEESAAAATKAVSDAIRRQLTTPGSVPPEEQVRLLFADRAAHKGGA